MTAMMDAHAQALIAMRSCLSGDTSEGVRQYQLALKASGGPSLPVGLHCQQLEMRGLHSEAQAIRRAGALFGADLSVAGLVRKRSPALAVTEYRKHITRGEMNAQMVANYLECLSLCAEGSAMRQFTDPELLLKERQLPVDRCDGATLERATRRLYDSSDRVLMSATKSIRNMDRVERTHLDPDPDIQTLHHLVLGEVMAYRDELVRAGHPYGLSIPPNLKLESWAVLSSGTGHNVPHIHGKCWIVAVLYLAWKPGPSATGDCGSLQVGPGLDGDPSCSGWPRASVMPRPGKLVLMPAYFTHWTVPLGGPGQRVSMAFNAGAVA